MSGEEVKASFARLTQYSDLCGDQDSYLAAAESMVNGSCSGDGAFGGVFALFAGPYRDAQATVSQSMVDARAAARDAAQAFTTVRSELAAADDLAQSGMQTVQVKAEAPSAYDGPGDVGSPGGVPGEVKYVNGVVSNVADATDTMAGGANAVDHAIRGLPVDGVSITADVTDTVTTGIGMGETDDDIDDYEDFEAEHGAGSGSDNSDDEEGGR